MSEFEEYMKSGKQKQSDVVKKSTMSQSMVAQLQSGERKANPYHAIFLEIGTDGNVKAEKSCPEFFNLAKSVGIIRCDTKDNDQPDKGCTKPRQTV